MFTRKSKYQLVGQQVIGLSGTLVDIGARNRVLMEHLPAELKYRSADITPGHDFEWNLERPIDVPDSCFDAVVALDVLEHLEQIHAAYREVLRIADNKLFISMPNMTCLSLRLQFLKTGHLGGKYDLLTKYQSDRHRWLTSYSQIRTFINHYAHLAHCTVIQYDILTGYGRLHNWLSYLPLPAALRTYVILFEITKPRGNSMVSEV